VDIWQRERRLARTTVGWGLVSSLAGVGLAAATRDPWRRSFGLQTAGWGVVDVAIAVAGERWQDRRMRKLPDPHSAAAQDVERVKLRRILLVNVAADVGYVALGLALARDARPRVAGSGVAVVIQGAFLLVHDSIHAVGAGARRQVPAVTTRDPG
jgi:hypothetical protein